LAGGVLASEDAAPEVERLLAGLLETYEVDRAKPEIMSSAAELVSKNPAPASRVFDAQKQVGGVDVKARL